MHGRCAAYRFRCGALHHRGVPDPDEPAGERDPPRGKRKHGDADAQAPRRSGRSLYVPLYSLGRFSLPAYISDGVSFRETGQQRELGAQLPGHRFAEGGDDPHRPGF